MEIYIKINKIKVKVSTNYDFYFRYIKLHFNKVIIPSGGDDFDISISADWVSSSLKLKTEGQASKIAANTVMGPNKITTIRKIKKRKKVKISFELKGKRLMLSAESRFKAFKDTLRYRVLNQPQDSYFFELTYALVYYPVFWYLGYFFRTYPIHASAVRVKDKAVVLYGMEGSGKTTLSLMLAGNEQADFLSDNIIFFDGEKIYPCYEPVRLHKDRNNHLWSKDFKKINRFRTPKDFYEPAFCIPDAGTEPGMIIFLRFTRRFFVSELPVGNCRHRIINSNLLVQELGNYVWYAAIMNLLVDDYSFHKIYAERLEALLSKLKRYDIGMAKADGINVAFNKINEIISDNIG